MRTTARTIALLSLLALLLTACGAEDTADTSDDDQADTEAADEEPADDEPADDEPADDEPADDEPADDEPAEASDGDAAVVTTASTDLGEVLVDGQDMTLYLFEPDDQGESTCYDTCQENWPPLVTESDPVAEDGAQDALLGTTERDDGSTQVTYDGWPLYTWIGDEAAGDTNGQGVEDVWWVLDADGAPLRDAEPDENEDTDDDSADTGSGY